MALEKYTIEDNADQGTDILVNLNLKQYKPYGAKIISFDSSGNLQSKSTSRASTREIPASATARPGETLWTVIKRVLGSVNDTALKYLSEKNDVSATETLQPGKEIRL
ncbi:hypothetical protein [Candidatus Methanomassiliicoccus intestinalis]|jgi:peptidoglycan-binding lysM|uniref:hypothetical protein n=1 Tax=Candidatus Methanomassiliicoccus intestinalis TaxID=1406512 RepID=UPI00204BEB3A|nr:MAG TPA: tail assembly protein [Caudoviricetes sp.]